MISISFLLLLLLGGGGAMVALIVFAIASKRLWVIPAVIGLVFFGLIACGLLASIFWGYAERGVAVETAVVTPFGEQMITTNGAASSGVQSFHESRSVNNGVPNFSGVQWSGGLKVILLVTVLIVIVFRWFLSPSAGHGPHKVWPVLVAIAILAMVIIGGMRVNLGYSSARTAASQAAANVAARQQVVIANQMAQIQSQASQQLVDIHEQMDKFDGPRIPLPPANASPQFPASLAPVAPAPPVAAQPATANDPKEQAEATDDEIPSKSKTGDKAKPDTGSDHKRKETDKSPASSDTKQPQTVAQSKPAKKSAVKKVKASTSTNDKSSTVADAKPETPGARPAWVDEKPKRTGNVRREVIATEEYFTPEECYQAADVYLLLKTYQYVQQLAGRPYPDFELPSLEFRRGMIVAGGDIISTGGANSSWTDSRLRYLNNLGINIDFARSELVAKDSNGEGREYMDNVQRPMGQMKKLYVQIEFTPAVERVIRQRLDAEQRQNRFAMAGAGAGSILCLLALVFALLKFDTWTKGYYTKRLFIGVPAAIIGFLLLLVFLDKYTSLL